jgi:integrase
LFLSSGVCTGILVAHTKPARSQIFTGLVVEDSRMPDITFTPKTVAALFSEKRAVFWDSSPLSPPRFCARVNRDKAVYYIVIANVWVKLGSTRAMSLEDARKAARVAYGRAAAGEDPRPTQLKPPPDTITVHELLMRYIQSRERQLAPATLSKYRYEAAKVGETPFGKRKSSSLVRADVEQYLDTIPKVSVRDYRFRLLRAAFRWGLDEEIKPGVFVITRDPTRKIREMEQGKKRTRRLSDDEIKKVWHGVESLGIAKSVYLRLLLLLGLRRGEAYLARWSDFDLDAATWTIPPEHRKIKRTRMYLAGPLMVPLPPIAVELLRDLKRFTGTSKPFRLSVANSGMLLKTASGVPDAFPHSFRATIAGRLEAAGCPPHTIRLVLGRAPKEYEAADLHYVTGQRPAEVRRWLEWWAEEVARIVSSRA